MVLFYPGVAGRRSGHIYGVVIHNDAGSQAATASFYRNWLPSHDAALGFAHVYIGSDGKYQAEEFENMAWHTANANGNANYVGWEVLQSMGNEETFRANEQAVFKDIAVFMKARNMQPNRTTVMLHQEFSATSCPHRSWVLHGQAVNAVKDYYIQEIKKYMGTNNTNSNSTEKPKQPIEKDDEIMFKYIKVLKNGREEQWFAGQGKRMYLPDGPTIENIDFLLNDLGKPTKATRYKEGSLALKAIETMYSDSKTFKK
ncbi:N-acetylmuramoyl-L-alanine amidase [Enterococcus rotai]|uniref:N-acetylmuramoyl-L-alanine amidase n=1 Tax=Enterococcus rotai TaxID=118060 RepID=UPI0035C73003